MTNLAKITKGAGAFLAGCLISISIYEIAPILLTLFTDTNQEGIMWFGIILTSIISMIIVPVGYIVQGLREPEPEENTVFGIASGIVYFIFALLLTFFGWFMVTALYNLIDVTILQIIFWIGMSSVWILTVIVTPFTKIINSSRQ